VNKILIGCSIKVAQTVALAYWRSLQILKIPTSYEVCWCFVDDSDGELEWDAAWPDNDYDVTIIESDPRPAGADYGITEQTHIWSVDTFDHLAKQKQKLLNYAVEQNCSHIMLVDSDLLLEPTTLLSMLSVNMPIVNAVFWTEWQNGSSPMPQVWLRHPYGLEGLGIKQHEFLHQLSSRQLLRVLGGGACTLFETKVFEKLHYYPRLDNLLSDGMWQGEDRTMAVLAQNFHVSQWADAWPNIYHAYHPDLRTKEALDEAWLILHAPRQLAANYGDLVSFVLSPLEEPALVGILLPQARCFRGRLGALDVLPEIEVALTEMAPAESKIITINFPYWFPQTNLGTGEVLDYAGKEKLYEITMIDIKPYGYAPVLAQHLFRGLDDC